MALCCNRCRSRTESESESVKSPESESELESEQHYHNSQTQQVLIEYCWDHNIVLLHDRPIIQPVIRIKRSMTTIRPRNLATLHRNKPIVRGWDAAPRCPERTQDTSGMHIWQGICRPVGFHTLRLRYCSWIEAVMILVSKGIKTTQIMSLPVTNNFWTVAISRLKVESTAVQKVPICSTNQDA